jgi:hypothetical protein
VAPLKDIRLGDGRPRRERSASFLGARPKVDMGLSPSVPYLGRIIDFDSKTTDRTFKPGGGGNTYLRLRCRRLAHREDAIHAPERTKGTVMQIQCECGAFRAQLLNFPRNTPGRLACYCDDCQTFAHHLNRVDLLDGAGGTEVIPVYPAEIQIDAGREVLKCLRLSSGGLYRWYASCCDTPVANVRPGFPWVAGASGVHRKRPQLS